MQSMYGMENGKKENNLQDLCLVLVLFNGGMAFSLI